MRHGIKWSDLKIGDTVYGFFYPHTYIIAVTPEKIIGMFDTCEGMAIETEDDVYTSPDIGRLVFFTEEEAKKQADCLNEWRANQ